MVAKIKGLWSTVRGWFDYIDLKLRLERKIEDLWLGVFWRVDRRAGRVDLWVIMGWLPVLGFALLLWGQPLWLPVAIPILTLIFGGLGLPGLPLHISWDTFKARQSLEVAITDQYDFLLEVRQMTAPEVADIIRAGRLELDGETLEVERGAYAIEDEAGRQIEAAVLRVKDPKRDAPERAVYDEVEGWMSWEEFYEDKDNAGEYRPTYPYTPERPRPF